MPLIITSGDVSDVDGFLALAEYAKTGADVLYTMNYPAYLAGDAAEDDFEQKHPGLGFRYGVDRVDAQTSTERMKSDLTNLAFTMATRVWNEASPAGRLLFMIGGVNKVNPFSPLAVKNELVTFAPFVSTTPNLNPEPGALYDANGQSLPRVLPPTATEIYVDFNGSMAFFDEDSWLVQALASNSNNVKGAFVMGGVEANKPPQTMPAIAGRLNRLSCATMNQLYHPPNTARFFQFLESHAIPVYIVPNNAVASLENDDGVDRFLAANCLKGEYLGNITRTYYATGAPRKPFDMYTAVALRAVLSGNLQHPTMRLFYSGELGISLLGTSSSSWDEAVAAYAQNINVTADTNDSDFVRAKKESFIRELELLRGLPTLPSLPVAAPTFVLDTDSRRLVA